MAEAKGRGLTRHEFDAVIRRAAELASSDPDGEGALNEAELFRIAREVGLDESHVRVALAEVRTGVVGAGDGFLDRVFGPLLIQARRVVPGTPRDLVRALDQFFVATQLLQPVRRGTGVLQYRPAVDWASQLARAASFTSRKYYVASAKSVEVRLEAVDDGHTLVELIVDPGTRTDNVWGAAIGGGSAGLGAGGGLGAAIALGGGALLLAIPAGAVTAAAVAAGVTYLVGGSHKKKILEVLSEVEGILDRLEVGESLEPPPASWRRWVKRQFHGVARDFLTIDEEFAADSDAFDDESGEPRDGGPRRKRRG